MLFTHTFQFHQFLIYEYINWIYQWNQPKCISFQIKHSISIAWSLIYILPCVWLFYIHLVFDFHIIVLLPPRSACATVGSAISFLTFWKRYILFLDFGSGVNGKISTPDDQRVQWETRHWSQDHDGQNANYTYRHVEPFGKVHQANQKMSQTSH